jgi:HEAT repeat protein/beta-lactamase regulating signal transducer with metallopeptidase domain
MIAAPLSSLLAGADPLPALFLKTSFVLGAAALASLALRNASASARHFAWTVAVAAALVLPLASRVVPFRLPVIPVLPVVRAPAEMPAAGTPAVETPSAPEAPAEGMASAYAPAAEALAEPGSPVPFAETPEPAAGTPAPAAAPDGVGAPGGVLWFGALPWKVLGMVWMVGAGLILARLLAGFATVWYLSRRGERVDDPEWTSLVARLERRFSIRTGIRLVRTDWTEMPMTFGTLRPVVLLPMGADEWPAERREVVLTHELAHIARADVLVLALAHVVCALHWFNPLAWMALKNLRAEAERCCDDWVLRAGTRASSYAEHLLTMVRSVGRARVPAAIALPMAQRSTFEGRLLAILEPGVDRGLVGRGRAALATLGVAAVVALLAAVGPAAPSAEAAPVAGSVIESPDKEKPAEDKGKEEEVKEGKAMDEERFVSGVTPQALATLAGLSAELETAAEKGEAKARTLVALSRSLGDASAEVRESAVRSMGQIEDPRSVTALINALRTDRDVRVREAAAWALGQIEDPRAVPALVEALSGDREVTVRRTAAWALGQIEDGAAVDGLTRAMHDADADVRQTAVWALGQIEDPRAIPGLSAALRDGGVETRRHAAWALGQIESADAVPALAAALRDADAEVRAKAVWGLGQIEAPQGVAPLIPLLRDRDAEVRRQAVWALGQIESREAVSALGGALRDDDSGVRMKAAWALGQIEDPAAAGALAGALSDRAPAVRAKAAWALGQIEPSAAPPALVQALRDEDRDVRRTVVWALGQIEDRSSAPGLRAALRDTDAEVRLGAVRALTAMEDPAGAEALSELLRDRDPQVRAKAAGMAGGHGWPDPRPDPDPRPQPQPRPRPMP